MRGQSGDRVWARVAHTGGQGLHMRVVTLVCMSTCIWQTDVTGRQMLFFWKILEVCPQSGCFRGAGPI